MKLALFDFDGTITTKDSLVDFIQYAVGKPQYYFSLCQLSPLLIAYKLKIIPNDIAKERLLAYFFKGWDHSVFQKISDQYSITYIDKIVRLQAMEKIKWHQKEGHEVVIVSASMECWLQKWCEKYNVALISTKLEVIDKKITGKFSTKNCYGAEKVSRIKEQYNLSMYEVIFAYGDSAGDNEMLSIATKKYYKYFF